MSKSRKIVALLLTVLMVLPAIAACGAKEREADKLVGTWRAELNIDDDLNSDLGEMEDYFSFEGYNVIMTFTFNEDGKYSIRVDRDATLASFAGMRDLFMDGFTKYAEALIVSMGVDATAEEVFEASGTSLEEIVDVTLDDFNSSLDDIFATMELDGNWDAADGKLYSTKTESEEISKNSYDLYELDGNTLSLRDPNTNELVVTMKKAS